MTDTKKASAGGGLLPTLGVVTLLGLGVALVYTLVTGPQIDSPPEQVADAGSAALPPLALPVALFAHERVAFSPIELDAAALKAARESLPGVGDEAPEDTEGVMEAYKDLSLKEIGDDKRAQEASAREFNLRLSEFFGIRHHEGVQALMSQTYPTFRASVEKLSARAQADKVPIESLLKTPTEELEDAIAWSGGFITLSRSLGLMDSEGRIPARLEPLVEVLYRYRMAQGLRGTINPKELLSGTELRTFLLWRLHEARGIPRTRRLSYAKELALYFPTYPTLIAQSVVHLDAGYPDDALSTLQLALQITPDYKPLIDRYTELIQAQAPPSPKQDAGKP